MEWGLGLLGARAAEGHNMPLSILPAATLCPSSPSESCFPQSKSQSSPRPMRPCMIWPNIVSSLATLCPYFLSATLAF